MFFGKRMSIGIDSDGRFINVVQLSRSRGQLQIEAATSIARADHTVPLDSEEISRLISVLRRQGFQGNSVVLALPNETVMTSILKMPNADNQENVNKRALSEMAASHQCSPLAIEASWWNLPEANTAQTPGYIMAVACRSELAHAAVDLFEEAGMVVRAIDVKPCAVSRACSPLLAGSDEITAIINIGWGFAEMVIVQNEIVIFERTLVETNLNQLHMSLMAKYALEAPVIDQLIAEIGCQLNEGENAETTQTDLAVALRKQIADYVDGLSSELSSSISYATQEYDRKPVTRLLITGEGSVIPGIDQRMSCEMKLKVQIVRPLDVVGGSEQTVIDCNKPSMLTAVGLASHPEG